MPDVNNLSLPSTTCVASAADTIDEVAGGRGAIFLSTRNNNS